MTKPAISNLTLGERLVVRRRREGMTQRDLADRFGLPRRMLQELERDNFTGEIPEELKTFAGLGGVLQNYEKCFIARRRAKAEVGWVADTLSVSRQWVNEMESGRERCDVLMALWDL